MKTRQRTPIVHRHVHDTLLLRREPFKQKLVVCSSIRRFSSALDQELESPVCKWTANGPGQLINDEEARQPHPCHPQSFPSQTGPKLGRRPGHLRTQSRTLAGGPPYTVLQRRAGRPTPCRPHAGERRALPCRSPLRSVLGSARHSRSLRSLVPASSASLRPNYPAAGMRHELTSHRGFRRRDTNFFCSKSGNTKVQG